MDDNQEQRLAQLEDRLTFLEGEVYTHDNERMELSSEVNNLGLELMNTKSELKNLEQTVQNCAENLAIIYPFLFANHGLDEVIRSQISGLIVRSKDYTFRTYKDILDSTMRFLTDVINFSLEDNGPTLLGHDFTYAGHNVYEVLHDVILEVFSFRPLYTMFNELSKYDDKFDLSGNDKEDLLIDIMNNYLNTIYELKRDSMFNEVHDYISQREQYNQFIINFGHINNVLNIDHVNVHNIFYKIVDLYVKYRHNQLDTYYNVKREYIGAPQHYSTLLYFTGLIYEYDYTDFEECCDYLVDTCRREINAFNPRLLIDFTEDEMDDNVCFGLFKMYPDYFIYNLEPDNKGNRVVRCQKIKNYMKLHNDV